MIKVLSKSVGVLEELAKASPAPVGVATLAEKLDINKATCSRILKDLRDLGYVEALSRQKGYVLSARSYAFSKLVHYNESLIDYAKPYLDDLSAKYNIFIVLAELKSLKRYILLQYNRQYSQGDDMSDIVHEDIWRAPTGILLVANADDTVKEQSTTLYGVPEEILGEQINSKEQLYEQLSTIAQQGEIVWHRASHSTPATAFPLYQKGVIVAAVGITFPGGLARYPQGILDEIRGVINQINQNLKSNVSL